MTNHNHVTRHVMPGKEQTIHEFDPKILHDYFSNTERQEPGSSFHGVHKAIPQQTVNPIDMLKIITPFLLLLIATLVSCDKKNAYKSELNPYVHFLEKDHQAAKDYVLDLFKENDLVIICERDHREYTQYQFIKELIADPGFIQNVGNIFTEVGMRNLNPAINEFIHSVNVPDSIRKQKVIGFQRRCSFYPLWGVYNYHYFIETLYEINQELAPPEKIHLYPTDVEINLDSAEANELKDFWNNKIPYRDSLMADYIMQKFDSIKHSKNKRKKALIIMNYRHSYNDNFKRPEGSTFANVGSYLFDQYPGKIANVLINPLGIEEARSDNDISWTALQDGKWDAAFKACEKDNIGFDLKGSPFGKDHFDHWPFYSHNYQYQDIFTGFIYYRSPAEFKIIKGVEGLIDSTFLETYHERVRLWEKAVEDNPVKGTSDSVLFKQYNKMNTTTKENMQSIKFQINSWLK